MNLSISKATMSSLDIADSWWSSRHVLRTIRNMMAMVSSGETQNEFVERINNLEGCQRSGLCLKASKEKRDSIVVAAQLSPNLPPGWWTLARTGECPGNS
uniref:Uncharacterized protein n=1 Tax=Salmonella sp. TaxID=599 RepID=A0A482EVZ3_SALSP|nr:hypothetical protein NNIBIDOC_00089 [Salmonella sp.]